MYIVVFITVPKDKATQITSALIRSKVAACVNIIKDVESFFWWKKKIDKAEESLLLVKSKRDKLQKIIKVVKSLHPYDIPEIIALAIVGGYKPYLDWIDESLI